MLGLCSRSEDALGPSRPVSTAGSRCVVCGVMFSPTSPAEGAPDLFISADEAAVSNSLGYLFERLYTALAALCSLTCGPMCAWPHASWLRTTRLLWAQIYYETGWGLVAVGWSIFFLIWSIFSFGVYIFRGSTNDVICTACTNVEYCTARTKSVCCALHQSCCRPSRSAFMHVQHFMYTLCELPYICYVNYVHACL